MTTAVIGTGVIGSVIARQLASGGETLRLASADHKSSTRPTTTVPARKSSG
jgi:predicted dinucleotide-binding enzyme